MFAPGSKRGFPAHEACKAPRLPTRRGLAARLWPAKQRRLNGLERALEPFDCADAGGGKSYLRAQPSITCWESHHRLIVGINVIVICFWVVLLPLMYIYVLGVLVPARGPLDPATLANFGFIYDKFETQYYWWHGVEILVRKVPLVLVSVFMTHPIRRSIVMLCCVTTIMVVNVHAKPYIKRRYDVYDQVSSAFQAVTLLIGILVSFEAQSQRLQEASVTVDHFDSSHVLDGAFYVLAVVMVFVVAPSMLAIDVYFYYECRDARRLCERHRISGLFARVGATSLDNGMLFDEAYLLRRWLAEAPTEDIARLRKVEARLQRVRTHTSSGNAQRKRRMYERLTN